MQDLKPLNFCPELVELLASRRVCGRSGKVFEGLGAISTINNLVTLRNLHLDLKPQRTLEVGLCFGASALLFTGLHRNAESPACRQHLAVDPFQTSVWDDAGLLQIDRAGLESFLDFRGTYSCLELPRLFSEGARFDLVYVDGSHLFEDVFVDAYFSCRLLTEGGVVAFDDCSDPNVAKVLTFIRSNLRSSFQELALGPFRADGGRTLRYRAAKFLGRTQLSAFRRIGPADRNWNSDFNEF